MRAGDVFCYDRYWDGNEFYEDDTQQDGAFLVYDKRDISADNKKLTVQMNMVKNFKNNIGSHDYEIKDG